MTDSMGPRTDARATDAAAATAATATGQARRPALDDEGCRRIHEAALYLLHRVGCLVGDAETRDVLHAAGAEVAGARVHIAEESVARALGTAPPAFVVAGRRPDSDLPVGPDHPTVLASASGPPFVLDEDGQRPGTLADLRVSVVLAHLSPNIAIQGNSVEATDVPEDRRARLTAHVHLTGSDKPFRHPVSTVADLSLACDLHEILYGAKWHERPRLWSVVNSTSPLQVSADAGQALVRLARLAQPVCYAACAMGGTTAPLTLAGLLALQHAEVLCGLVITQTVRPGCPFIYGGTSSLSSMQTGALMVGVPEYWTLTEGTVLLARWLGLPVRAGGALTDAHVPDAQAGAESAIAIKTALDLGADFVLHAAGILSSFNCYSPVKFIVDDEILGALRAAAHPVVVDDETLALDVTAGIGPGGSALASRHTRRHARAVRRTTIMNRAPFQAWRALGGHDLAESARRRVTEALAAYAPPDDLDAVTRRQLDAYCLR